MKKFKHKNVDGLMAIKQNGKVSLVVDDLETSNDWEEIVEKDYEILSRFIDLGDIQNRKIGSKMTFTHEDGEINSIKRLSDGEIFTLQDYISHPNSSKSTKISKIVIEHERLEINTEDGYWTTLEMIKKCEKPVERDYEILSFINKSNEVIFEKCKNGKFSTKYNTIGNIGEGFFLNVKHFNINSIKRLSDGEVFSLGDKVIENITSESDEWTISEFSLKDSRCFTCGVNINCLEKVIEKPVIFTTEDGVEVRKGDITTAVNQYNEILKECKYKGGRIDWKYFSTREAAEKYIEENKPKYSLKDVERAFGGYMAITIESIIQNLKNLK